MVRFQANRIRLAGCNLSQPQEFIFSTLEKPGRSSFLLPASSPPLRTPMMSVLSLHVPTVTARFSNTLRTLALKLLPADLLLVPSRIISPDHSRSRVSSSSPTLVQIIKLSARPHMSTFPLSHCAILMLLCNLSMQPFLQTIRQDTPLVSFGGCWPVKC